MAEYSVPTPKQRYQCTRDDRLRVQTLFYHAGFTKDEIALQLNLSLRQVKYALMHQLTPQKRRTGRRPFLGPNERRQLVEWVCASAKNRRIPWDQIPAIFGWDCHVYAIETAFKLEGFKRCTALKKPDLTAQHAAIRLNWALEHVHWTVEEWAQILWSDKSWIQPGRYKKVKVTRRAGEALHRDCLEPKTQRKIGWMFWGSISGLYGKGPGIFWEKNWGTISSESYLQRIAPTVQAYALHRGLVYMQDNATSHSAKWTLEQLELMGIKPIFWPAKSPDLNPIETIWNIMKDYIEEKYPQYHSSYIRLKEAVLEAWDSITEGQIRELIESMPVRCKAVIEADGWHTKY
ncbi:transposable element tc1 transposase protein [Rutstroemia sp. NJR-2017a BVV2]|nr:transposable element tc1 transposase protein [Rutstroemia sp. NJR-2017a BVV2]